MVHEHCKKAQNGTRVEKVWESLLYANRVWGRPITWLNFYRPKMGKNLTNLNWYILVITDSDEKCFLIFKHTINHLFFGNVRLSLLEYYLSFTSFFFLFFLFLLPMLAFKPLYALYSTLEGLEISGRAFVRQKLGVPVWGDPPQLSLPKFWTFKPLKLDGSRCRNG